MSSNKGQEQKRRAKIKISQITKAKILNCFILFRPICGQERKIFEKTDDIKNIFPLKTQN